MPENEQKDDFFKNRLNDGTQEHKLQVYLIKSIEKGDETAGRLIVSIERGVETANELKKSIEEGFKTAERLKNKILWLNIVLTAATAIGAFAAFWMAFGR